MCTIGDHCLKGIDANYASQNSKCDCGACISVCLYTDKLRCGELIGGGAWPLLKRGGGGVDYRKWAEAPEEIALLALDLSLDDSSAATCTCIYEVERTSYLNFRLLALLVINNCS